MKKKSTQKQKAKFAKRAENPRDRHANKQNLFK